MTRMQKVETLVGEGEIKRENGTSLGIRAYQLTRWQRIHDDGRGGQIPGLFSIEGHITLNAYEGLELVGESLVLELQDGRALPFFFKNNNGQIAARGALK